MAFEKLAEIIFPNVEHDREYYIAKYPKRNLKEGARVTRYAPSPTGFQHIGGVFAALINERLASQSEGVFYLRIEDTDQKREVEGAIEDTITTMHNFGMDFSEGMTGQETSKGEYGPYRQSERAEIYRIFAKDLLLKGLAYPDFCTPEELAALREEQIANKITPGYYGEYAKYRNITEEEAIERINNGESYILRLKSPGNIENRVEFHDLIKGDISFPENNQDVVLIKGDGLPTYHFAHAIDDYLMRTTDVIRGEEWLSSLPIHVQLFDVLGFERPNYAHIPTIMKQEGGSKRKLSKRKDAEAAVSYYNEVGYPVVCVIEYLLNIVNSSYEEWRAENPIDDYHEFHVALEKMSKSGALFDLVKLNDVSKDVIARMSADKVYEQYTAWAKQYDEEMYNLVTSNEAMAREIFNIDKEGPKPRKDFAKWDEVKDKLKKSALALSGGQQQRLCIARTIAVSPEIILMDEPTSALDPISTNKMEELMVELKKQYTVVIVTHNMQQAGRIADKTAFFLSGEVVEYGNTEDIFYRPRDKRTEDYITGRFG